jgi:predicted dehydrogenase
MSSITAAVIGTGPDPDNPTVDGFAMGYEHGDAYEVLDGVELVACADIVAENAAAFADAFGLDGDAVFEDYEAMLAAVEPDVVSVCVPPAVHADVVVDCARSGHVGAVHCEKPMALTWGEATRMAQEADRQGVQLTFNHQRRFGDHFREAKRRLDDGEIGDLQRVEYTWGNFYDNGTHCIDMCNYFNDEVPPEWVIGQLDYATEDVRFGTHNENQMWAQWRYQNGVYGVASTAEGGDLSRGDWHLYGTEGEMAVDLVDGHALHVRRDGDGWETETFDGGGDWIRRAIEDVTRAYAEDGTSELRARNALNATEIIFGGYESVRSRRRVEFPLDVEDNPLESMVESGDLRPEPTDDG